MLARRGRTRPRLFFFLACAGYSGRDVALTWTAAAARSYDGQMAGYGAFRALPYDPAKACN